MSVHAYFTDNSKSETQNTELRVIQTMYIVISTENVEVKRV